MEYTTLVLKDFCNVFITGIMAVLATGTFGDRFSINVGGVVGGAFYTQL